MIIRVFDMLPRYDIVHKAGLVCKAWLALTRYPQLWTTLDHQNGLKSISIRIKNMVDLLGLLRRRQFTSLKTLSPPSTVFLRKNALSEIAESCPLLEEINLGCSLRCHMKPTRQYLLDTVSIFPHLSKIRFNNSRIMDDDIRLFCVRMGDRLREIRIEDETTKHDDHQLTNKTLRIIGRHCPNLELFQYTYNHHDISRQNPFTAKGIISLLTRCTKLRSLALIRNEHIGLNAFEFILEDSVKLERLFVVDHEQLKKNKKLCKRLSQKLRLLQILTKKEHEERILKRPTYWW